MFLPVGGSTRAYGSAYAATGTAEAVADAALLSATSSRSAEYNPNSTEQSTQATIDLFEMD